MNPTTIHPVKQSPTNNTTNSELKSIDRNDLFKHVFQYQ